MSVQIKMYTTLFCPYCMRARQLLDSKGAEYADIAVDRAPELRREMIELSGQHTVPQIWIDELHVGGFDDLALLERLGTLNELLDAA